MLGCRSGMPEKGTNVIEVDTIDATINQREVKLQVVGEYKHTAPAYCCYRCICEPEARECGILHHRATLIIKLPHLSNHLLEQSA